MTFGGGRGRSRPGFGANMCPSGQASIGHKPGASEGGSVGEGPRGAFRAPSGREPFFRTPGLATWKPTSVLNKIVAAERRSVGEVSRGALRAPSVRKPFFRAPLPGDLGTGIGFEEACCFGRGVGSRSALGCTSGTIGPGTIFLDHRLGDLKADIGLEQKCCCRRKVGEGSASGGHFKHHRFDNRFFGPPAWRPGSRHRF